MVAQVPECSSRLRLLVVDDNRDAADSLCLLASLWGYDARAAYDGQSGLEAALAHQPDCLILDIKMPGLDGLHLARQLRDQPSFRRAKLVAITGFPDMELGTRIRQAGFDYLLLKPADPVLVEELLQILQQILRLGQRTERLTQEASSFPDPGPEPRA